MVFLRFTDIQKYNITSIRMKYNKIHHKWFEEAFKFNSLYKQINRVNKLLPWDLTIFLNSLRGILDFKFCNAPSLTFPTHLGNTKKPRIHLSLELDFYFGNSCDADKSTLYVPGSPYLVHSCASDVIGEWLSIIARSELGSDLDCSVINARSELGSDLDCYELTLSARGSS